MPFKIQCPGCSDKVLAEESDRGKSIKCGTCWTGVPVPAAAPEAAKPPTAAKPVARLLPNLPATVPAKAATATPAAGVPLTAVVLKTATVVVAAPVADPDPKPGRKKAKDAEKPRFKQRNRDDDDADDDDTPRKKGKKKGGAGLLIGLGAGAFLMVCVCGGFGWWAMKPSSDTAATAPGDGPNVAANNPGKPPHWRAIAVGDGFAMDAPGGEVTKTDIKVTIGKEALDAQKYVKKDGDSSVQVAAVHCDLKGEALKRFDHTEMMSAMFAMPKFAGRGPRFIGEREAREYVLERGSNHDFIWILKMGDRAYGFQFHWESPDPAGVQEIKEAFFRSVSVGYGGGGEPLDTIPFNPNAPPDPAVPVPIEQPWVAIANSAGFSAEAPRGAKVEKVYLDANGKSYHGRKYTSEDPRCQYVVAYHDVPVESKVDVRQVVQSVLPFIHTIADQEDSQFDGKPATKWTLRHIHGGPGYATTVRVGFRVFTFMVTSRVGLHAKADPSHEERSEKFFKSVKIAFDPKKYDPFADEPAWGAMAKTDGFSALAPKGTVIADYRTGIGADEARGTEYKADDEGVTYQIYACALPPGKSIDALVTEQVARRPIIGGPTVITIDGNTAEELIVRDHSKFPVVIRSVKVGNTALIAKVTRGSNKMSEMEFEARKAKFFANFRIGGGGGTPVGNPGDPGTPPPAGAAGEFVKAGKVLPFSAAVVLFEKKELVTLSVRDANAPKPGGTLRRYGFPDLKLKATYQIPLPVNRAVADEKTGRLYCATVNAYERAFSERELSFAAGDIQIFDLDKLTDGKLPELGDVKPLATVAVGTRISGLEIAPDAPLVFVSALVQSKDRLKTTVWKGRLYKIETDKQKIGGEIDTPDPIWSIRLSPDGGKLYAGGMPMTPGGGTLLNIARPTGVEVVDTALWKRTKSLPFPAALLDIALAGDRVLALVSAKAEPSLLAVDEVADLADLTPRAEAMGGARYLRTSPDGKKLLISGGPGSNAASYYEAVPGAPPRLARIAGGNQLDAQPLGGHFVFSPDGKYAIFNSGVVLDLDKTAGKK